MLVRAARKLRHGSRGINVVGEQPGLPRIRLHHVRWTFTGTSRPRLAASVPRWREKSAGIGRRPDLRQVATATAYQPSPDPVQLLYGAPTANNARQVQRPMSDLRQWDPTRPLLLAESMLQPPPVIRHALGIGGDIAELFQNLYACLRVNRIERAENIVMRIQEILGPSSPEVIRAHNVLIEALVEELESLESPRDKEIIGVQKWFERALKPTVPPNGDTYALMCRAALAVRGGIRRDRTLRRYLSLANHDGLLDDSFDSEKLTDAQADVIQQVYSGLSADRVLAERHAGTKTGEASTLSFHNLSTGNTFDIKQVDQKGEGLRTLVRSLHYVNHLGAVQFPHDENLTNKQKEMLWAKRRQEAIEMSVADEALSRWRKEHDQMLKMGISTALTAKPVAALLWQWHSQLEPLVQQELNEVRRVMEHPQKYSDRDDAARQVYGPYLEALSSEELSAFTIIQTMRTLATVGIADGVKLAQISFALGRFLEHEARAKRLYARKSKPRMRPERTTMQELTEQITDNFDNTAAPGTAGDYSSRLLRQKELGWPTESRTQIAALLVSKLLKVARVTVHSEAKAGNSEVRDEAGLTHESVYKNGRKYGIIRLHSQLVEMLKREPVQGVLGAQLPMIVEPVPWTSYSEGGYLLHPSTVVRAKENSDTQKLYTIAAAEKGHMAQVFEGLNVLGKVPWRINQAVFKVMVEAWNSGEAIADIAPASPDLPYPPEPTDSTDHVARRVWLQRKTAVDNERSGLHSQRCFQNFQIEIARAYLDQTFYCPHNLDFRGRVYPIPPYLNHMGADNARGLLIFGKGKQLGETGLRWLKIHLANVYGFDKASLTEREDFAMQHLEDVFDSATNPLGGRQWWLKADDPWQCLATCFELKNALESPDPTTFISHLPIHQDGTCNGLQHYAALGGDTLGAQQVNLEPGDRPADIYTAVARLVKEEIAKDAGAQHPMALKLEGKITRKVVKQTVMTNVYGVTFVGARAQVQKQLDNLLPDNDADPGLSNYMLSAYIAHKIFAALDTMFNGAQNIQRWLGQCADRISTAITPEQLELIARREAGDTDAYGPKISTKVRKFVRKLKATSKLSDEFRSCVVWTTPLKMPVVQPYRTTRVRAIRTTMQDIALREPQLNDPVAKRKQLQAFPPNFIHSLDATHMMLSALKCNEHGLTFASVHDSFWTHAADVPVMNRVLRDAFVRMHSEDITGRLAAEFTARYKRSIYLTHVYARSPVGRAIAKLRRGEGIKGRVTNMNPNGKQSMQELLEEHKRQKLLRSKDPEQRESGMKMVTPASLFEAAVDAESFLPPVNMGATELGSIADADNAVEPSIGVERAEKDCNETKSKEALAVGSQDQGTDWQESKEKVPRKKAEPRIPLWLPLTFPTVPTKGDFDVTRLRDSQYFFS